MLFKRNKKKFSDYIKNEVSFVKIENRHLPIERLHVQYNPERFEKYKSVHDGSLDTVLNMSVSPHCRLLETYKREGEKIWSKIKKSSYYKMQRRFGKNSRRAILKARKLIKLYEDIKENGFNSSIIVLEQPLIVNEFNRGYEILEGHHRVACCISLGIESVDSEIVQANFRKSFKEWLCD